jgi:hypothetical protein
MYAERSGNSILHQGNGISIANDTIKNTAPDQIVTLNGIGQTNVVGVYPNFSINTPSYTSGSGISINNNVISAENTQSIWNANKLQGKQIDSLTPTIGKILQYENNQWKVSDKLPQMSTAQRESISSPYAGMTILNTNTDCIEYYNGIRWLGLCGTDGNVGSSETGGLQSSKQLLLETQVNDSIGLPQFSIGNDIYFICFNCNSQVKLASYNVVTKQFTNRSSLPNSPNQYGYAAFSDANYGYLFTVSTTAINSVFTINKYNPIDNSWSILATRNNNYSLSNANYLGFIGSINNKFGFGLRHNNNFYFYCYNYITSTWTENVLNSALSGYANYWNLQNRIAVLDLNGLIQTTTLNDSIFTPLFNPVIGPVEWSQIFDYNGRHIFLRYNVNDPQIKLYEVFPDGNTVVDLNINIISSGSICGGQRPIVINNTIYLCATNKLYKLKL